MTPLRRSADNALVGIDIGGANLKYADNQGRTLAVDFPLWRKSDDLAKQLIEDLRSFAPLERLLVTMTGELADCFLDRGIGVRHIVDHANQAADAVGVPLSIYGVGGRWYSPSQARDESDHVAAANWHALAAFTGLDIESDGLVLLVDIGSTTSDLIPIRDGKVATEAVTDFDRLCEGSLVYVGGQRTPVCALVDRLHIEGRSVPVMREVFSTMDDVRLLLGFVKPSASCETADGSPRDLFHSANRLARMVGLGHREVSLESAGDLALQVHQAARKAVHDGLERLKSDYPWIANARLVLSGHADDLVSGNFDAVSLSALLGVDLSRCAPAYALVRLWEANACVAS
ncbi:hydantoinase/oxoprolinase family protein [Rhodopirellula sp. MGV]|uniref:hydantoinase/oxoprolinase family protein n=1 Tax=Rhodopirellula sp. MGV TaxID=2023130 RepID=UPI000B967B95|nr:hydantoinase/oxoprolinase family protein [Rhodopirellula sp. MGV]OYP34035.1 hypothetical protein CGZ80_16620 [Rhodopirellula sp. MGV]PNY38337.1 tetrahydromethanopterin-linked C1 transfer pathway [Rhodopirellula baltica]